MVGPQIIANRPSWFNPIGILSFSLSLAVNAIFTGLLVFKIAKVSLALRHTHARKISDFTLVISMLIESGLVIFMAQLVWVICFAIESSVYYLTSTSITIIYVRVYSSLYLPLLSFNIFFKGIVPTAILLRVAMADTADTTCYWIIQVVKSTFYHSVSLPFGSGY